MGGVGMGRGDAAVALAGTPALPLILAVGMLGIRLGAAAGRTAGRANITLGADHGAT